MCCLTWNGNKISEYNVSNRFRFWAFVRIDFDFDWCVNAFVLIETTMSPSPGPRRFSCLIVQWLGISSRKSIHQRCVYACTAVVSIINGKLRGHIKLIRSMRYSDCCSRKCSYGLSTLVSNLIKFTNVYSRFIRLASEKELILFKRFIAWNLLVNNVSVPGMIRYLFRM